MNRSTSLLSAGAALLAALPLNSCSGSGGGSPPAGISNSVQAYTAAEAALAFRGITQLQILIPAVLIPGMHASAGITFQLDTGVGAAPHTYDYVIPFDSTGDGLENATLSGSAVFSDDPTLLGILAAGFEASVDATVVNNGGQGVFVGALELAFDTSGEFRVHGTGSYTDASTGSTIDVAVDAAEPLLIRAATGQPGTVANACTWSVDGPAQIDAANGDGTYAATWSFLPGSALVSVANAVFTPPGGSQEALPDSQFEISPCPSTGSIGDWSGSYSFEWFCQPAGSGDSALTITVLDANTIEISDESPPGSGSFLFYTADIDANDPHVAQGSYSGSDGGGTYEEQFLWILSNDSQSFHKVAEYLYVSGPAAGSGGTCGGLATRN